MKANDVKILEIYPRTFFDQQFGYCCLEFDLTFVAADEKNVDEVQGRKDEL